MTEPIRVPANVELDDAVIGPFTARQVIVLLITGATLYGLWALTRPFVPVVAFLILALPVMATAIALVVVRRDGLTLDRLLLAAIRQRLSPRRRVAVADTIDTVPTWLSDRAHGAPEAASAPVELPAHGVSEAGVIDLGEGGRAMIAVASTVNFALRTPAEQHALVACLARYLHSLTAPVQILIRAERLDLSQPISDLHEAAAQLPHPALEQAALEHADYLTELGEHSDLLRRQVLIVLRVPVTTTVAAAPLTQLRGQRKSASGAAEETLRAIHARLLRRLTEAGQLLSPAGITLTPLDASQVTAVLASACSPESLLRPSAGLAGADEVITLTAPDEWDPQAWDTEGWG